MTKQKKQNLRTRAMIRRFFARKILPLVIAGMIFMGMFVIAIVMGVTFRSPTHMAVVCGSIVLIFSGLVWGIAQYLVKKMTKGKPTVLWG